MTRSWTFPGGRTAVRLALAAVALALGGTAKAEFLVGLTAGNALLTFDSATPGATSGPVGISGLQSGETILGIDIRPATNVLYGLGSTGRLYTLSAATGAATQVGTGPFAALSGSQFGFDFNPTVDLIRVVSDAGQNLRLNPVTGGLQGTDGALNYGANTGLTGTPSGVAAGYTNSDQNPSTGTTLYTIDSVSDRLFVQAPPNNGTLINPAGAGSTDAAPLGIDIGTSVGFDISGPTGVAYLASGDTLYTVSLTTGAATSVGTIGAGEGLSIIGLAAPIQTPAPATLLLFGLGLPAVAALRRRRA